MKQFKVKQKKKKKGGFLSMLLGANMPAGKGMNRTGEGIIRAGYGSKRSSI